MVNLIIKGKKIPGRELAHKIAQNVCADPEHQQDMYFYLRSLHRHYERMIEECPSAFESFMAAKEDEGVRIV